MWNKESSPCVGGLVGVGVWWLVCWWLRLLVVVPGVSAVAAPSNVARAAGVTVSASSQNTGTGQTAVKAVDGSAVGYPGDYTREWATAGGGAGSWIQLSWAAPVTIDRVVLYDRPNTSDQVTAGNWCFLRVRRCRWVVEQFGCGHDGHFLGADGDECAVQHHVGECVDGNVGLSEFEVWGEAGTPTNRPPVASRCPISRCSKGVAATLDGSGSSDPEGTALTYQWVQTVGPGVVLSGTTAAKPTFTPTVRAGTRSS